MPAFVTHGPDVPERLLQAHEEGRVVFFCGAGISYPAGLPDFRGLVECIYEELHTIRTPIEDQVYKKKQYDATLNQLEHRYRGQRLAVRTVLINILKPKWRKKGATATHQALLKLATDRKGKVRLVTTNFDHIFQRVINRQKSTIPSFTAPLLPIPKPSRWHGVVYLHGLLPDSPDETELNRLVLTSGDFGLAYLTERWASRFVSELFRNYTVCFVGYSIDDPILRYMMDALAVDELLGETRPEAYAFTSFHNGEREQVLIEWKAKGVTPLLYEEPTADTQDHSALHRTLKNWRDTYRDGGRGKEMIVSEHATTPPLTSSRSDFAVGRVLWALTDGLAAKHFANLNPVPPLKWLAPLAEAQFGYEDLARFGVVSKSKQDDSLLFSMIQRPAPNRHSPRMCIADMGARGSDWDEVMSQLAFWLTRHLDDPELILWLSKQGGQLHEQFARLIRNRIEHLDRLAHDGKQNELDRISANAPKAIPGPLMRILWRLILSGRLKSHVHHSDLYNWLHRFKQDGLAPTLRMELREILTPRVTIRKPSRLNEERDDSHEPEQIKDLVDWEIVLSGDHVHSALCDRGRKPAWQAALPELLQDFTLLLRDALDLMRELGGADDKSDLSYIAQPSISEHPQNRDSRDWTALIALTRDAWLAMVQTNPAQARLVAKGWWHVPYPLFKRLVFFAAANSNVITPREALNWLLADGHWWLWSQKTEREAIRLLVALAPKLDALALAEMEQAILEGPLREMFKGNIDPGNWMHIVNRKVWLRLAKMQAAGAVLGQTAKTKLNELTQQYPNLQLEDDERDEFPFWTGEGDELRNFVFTPRRRRDLMNWLKQPSTDLWQKDDWQQRCCDDFPIAASALCGLAQEGKWPAERWREALQAWAEDKLLKRSWRYMAAVISKASDDVMAVLSISLGWWLKAEAKTFEGQDDLFFALIRRLLKLEYQDKVDANNDSVSCAINHPVGYVTEALLHWWYRQKPKEAEGLRAEVKLLFTELCDTRVEQFRHGRVLLSTHAIALFRVDEDWTRTHLLPLFDWQHSEAEARAAWKGFLCSPRLYRPLLAAIKQQFLATVTHYGQLGEQAEQYANFLTFAALDPGDTFTSKELAEATCKFPASGLESAAQALARALEGAGEQLGEYWHNRVLPYLNSVWPKSLEVMTPTISEHLGQLCIAAREAFPEAMVTLRHWLQPVEYPDYIVHLLNEAKLCEQFPLDALTFLDAVISDYAQWLPRELKQCLDDISNVDQALIKDLRFIRLAELCRRKDIS